MTANSQDFFKKVGTSTVTTLSAPGKPIGATSINVGSTTGYPTDTGVIISIRTVDTAGTLIAGTHTEWLATVTSGTSLAIEAAPVYGSDQIYAAGSTTQVAIRLSSYSHNKLIDGLLVEHKQTGKHSDLTADSVKTDTITGTTDADSGDIYGITVTNGKMSGDDLADGSVTIPKISNPYKFNVHKSTATNLTGTASDTVVFDIEDTDTNNNYNASTGNYTIPVTGFYLFTAHCRIDSGSSVLKQIFIAGEKLSVYDGANQCVIGGSIMKQFTAGDTVSVTLYHGGSATIVADGLETSFSGTILSV